MEFITTNWELFLRIFVAFILGVILGTERTTAHRTAGMRTFSLVSMGAALFVIISGVVMQQGDGFAGADPLRMASQVIVGIGFLGAGLIIMQENRLTGLTTAAGLWVSAGIGMAVGFGLYSLAIFTAILTFLIFRVLWVVERRLEAKIAQGNQNS